MDLKMSDILQKYINFFLSVLPSLCAPAGVVKGSARQPSAFILCYFYLAVLTQKQIPVQSSSQVEMDSFLRKN